MVFLTNPVYDRTYKRVESSLIQNRLNLLQKKPEIERSLKAVLYLIKKRVKSMNMTITLRMDA